MGSVILMVVYLNGSCFIVDRAPEGAAIIRWVTSEAEGLATIRELPMLCRGGHDV
jgi:hypothetical protein